MNNIHLRSRAIKDIRNAYFIGALAGIMSAVIFYTIRPLLFLIILIGLWFWYIMTKLSNNISAEETIKARLGKEAK